MKVSRIVGLVDDIALNMASDGVRIEAPIPGKPAVGIEIPNQKIATVSLRDVLESPEMMREKSPTAVALGKGISGAPVIADMAKMPHVLIAGATGSGKSVCINTIINSIIFRARPEEVRLILIDPKVVELSVYNGIPHLLKAGRDRPEEGESAALSWAVVEMEHRYKRFETMGVRDIRRLQQRHRPERGADEQDHRHHRRAGRFDDGRPRRGGGIHLPTGAAGARGGHPSGDRDAEAVGQRHHGRD